ncbi:MAG TPA: pyrroline-5-carboxylate reductase [Steroidobacteraceae bacterium]|nr:pyrroline-5-carboxylate reductase [Steroidobacteraceae bacterium]
MQIGFIGAGNIARALIGGLTARGFEARRIEVCDPVPTQRQEVAERFGVGTNADNAAAARRADALILAVKPQVLRDVATALRQAVQEHRPLVVSVVAGIRMSDLSSWLGGYERIVRTMPNRPALSGVGIAGLFARDTLSQADRRTTEELLGAVGQTVWVPQETDLDTVTAVSGSGPAYFFLLMEMLEESARELGLAADTARTLAIETAYGAAVLARSREFDPGQLREQVTSKGGTTAAALAVLEQADVRGIVRRAVAAACRRSAELAREFGS